ncbi:MAG: NADH-quinone oxidoreductase subunit C [Actinobacteria bacterium]|nr:NADH-quinone oxidoreductase subunit C [Actinomycetota bacterium]
MAQAKSIDELSAVHKQVASVLQSKFGRKFAESSTFRGELTYVVAPEDWHAVLEFCRDTEELQFDRLDCLCGNHFPEREEAPFEVIANLVSIPNTTRVRVKTRLSEDQSLPTVTDLWPSAGFDERETWEMYGIGFEGNPNLTRLLTVPDFNGFPLRKDFPLQGTVGGRIRWDFKGEI